MIRFNFKFNEEELGKYEEEFLHNRDPRYECIAQAFCINMFDRFNDEGIEVVNPMYNGEEFWFDKEKFEVINNKLKKLLERLGFVFLYDANDEYAYLEGDTLRVEYISQGICLIDYAGNHIKNVINGLTIYFDMSNKAYTEESIINSL